MQVKTEDFIKKFPLFILWTLCQKTQHSFVLLCFAVIHSHSATLAHTSFGERKLFFCHRSFDRLNFFLAALPFLISIMLFFFSVDPRLLPVIQRWAHQHENRQKRKSSRPPQPLSSSSISVFVYAKRVSFYVIMDESRFFFCAIVSCAAFPSRHFPLQPNLPRHRS